MMDNQQQNNYKSQTAELLLKLKAIKLNPSDPFIWASGLKSPIYCDNRILLSDPGSRNTIANYFTSNIDLYISFSRKYFAAPPAYPVATDP